MRCSTAFTNWSGKMNNSKRGNPDFVLLIMTFILVSFGLLFVYSSSIAIIPTRPEYFLQRQGINVLIGIASMLFFMNINYEIWRKNIIMFFVVICGLLMATLIIGQEINNAKSWIRIAGFSLQPSEFAKLFIIVYLASIVAKKKERMEEFKKGFIPPLLIVGMITLLILSQPDIGSASIIIFVSLIMIYIGGGSNRRWLSNS